MPMPANLIGIAHSADNNQNVSLTLDPNKPASHRTDSQAFYQDGDKKWYVKHLNKEDALVEVISSYYFRFLMGDDCSPEVRLLQVGNEYYVLSADTEMKDLNVAAPLTNLAKVLIASYLLNDGDCKLENLKQVGNRAFRIDFGAGLFIRDDENKDLPFIESVNDLGIAFPVKKYLGLLQPQDFRKAIEELTQKKPEDFDWAYWQQFVSETNINIELQKRMLIERSKLLKAQLSLTPEESAQTVAAEHQRLVQYYDLINQIKALEDCVFCLLPSNVLANRHLRYAEEYKEPPIAFKTKIQSIELHQLLSAMAISSGEKPPPNLTEQFLSKLNDLTKSLKDFVLENINYFKGLCNLNDLTGCSMRSSTDPFLSGSRSTPLSQTATAQTSFFSNLLSSFECCCSFGEDELDPLMPTSRTF